MKSDARDEIQGFSILTMKQKKSGIFIPLEIIQNKDLDWLNKILLTEIIQLTKLKNGCTASNEFLANFLQIQKSSIHRRIKFLVENGYITTSNQYSGKKCIGRIIKHTGKVMVAQSKGMVAHATTLVAQATINGSVGDHSMVATSDPINTFINTSNTFINTVSNTGKNYELEIDHYLLKKNIK